MISSVIYPILVFISVIAVIIFLIYKKSHSDGDGKVYAVCGIGAFAIFTLLTMIFYNVAMNSVGKDDMVLNGYVKSKKMEKVSCQHSYQCNCITTKVGNSTSTSCQTCYEHSHDFAWMVYSNVGSTEIDRIDRRGSKEPPRFTSVVIGEPFSKESSYFNYIKASPTSVFKDFNVYKDFKTPEHPKIYDYYRVSHVLLWGSQFKDVNGIDKMLSERLKVTSSKVKANVLVIFYGGDDQLINAMKQKTLGGRINDVTIFIKADKDGNITNTGAFSWSKNDMVNVKLRDDIKAIGNLSGIENSEKLVDIIDQNLLKYYKHRTIEEFEYLKDSIELSNWYYFLVFLSGMILSSLIYILLRK